MIVNLREAKSRFSELVKRAADGEVILITVRGEPMARLAGVASGKGAGDRAGWLEELAEATARESYGYHQTPQGYWDAVRASR